MNLYTKTLNYLKKKKINRYESLISKKKFYSPYPIQIFESFINQIIEKRYNTLSFGGYNKGCNFIFRIDLDTQLCLENFHQTAKVLNNKNIKSSFFFRVDDMDYDSNDSYSYVAPFLENFRCGLHSSCYIHNDYVNRLEIEIEKFISIFGFRPKLLTLHGFGEYKYDQRQDLIAYLAKNHEKLGIEFADCIPEHRTYDYVIQDCHLENNRRYLKNDILILPPIMRNTNYLFLTHPCYWR